MVLFSPPTSNHHLTNLPQDLVFIAGKDLSLGTIQQHFNKIKFAGLSIKTKTIKCGKHGAILMMDEFSENFQKAFDKIYCNFSSKISKSLKSVINNRDYFSQDSIAEIVTFVQQIAVLS